MLLEEDLFELEIVGPTRRPGPDLVLETSAGLVFTMRGLQYFTHALSAHQVDAQLGQLRTLAELQALCESIRALARRRVRQRLEADYLSGCIPAKDRELVHAKLYGAFDDSLAAMERRLSAAVAGPNVVPVRFG